jgi:hypothetical protein
MKHLKSFEAQWIKHTDKIAQEHIANTLGVELEKILIEVKNSDTKNTKDHSVRRYYNDQKEIEVKYVQHLLYTFGIFIKQIDENNIEMRISIYGHNMHDIPVCCQMFYLFATSIMKPYNTTVSEKRNYYIEHYLFPKEKLPVIIERFKEYYIHLAADRYNL